MSHTLVQQVLRSTALSLSVCLVATLSPVASGNAQAQTAPAAAGLSVGAPISLPANIQDQHGQPWAITPETQTLLFSSDKDASATLQKLLKSAPEGHLASQKAVYLTDLSGMPGFITRNMALPKLKREYPFSIGILLDGTPVEGWPKVENGVTIVDLQNGLVQSVRALKSASEMAAALGLPPPLAE